MKIWVDAVTAPEGDWFWAHSVHVAQSVIQEVIWDEYDEGDDIELIDIDHDAGEYAKYGGDYIKLLEWLEERGLNYPIHIHSQNPDAIANMRQIIERNGWKEIT